MPSPKATAFCDSTTFGEARRTPVERAPTGHTRAAPSALREHSGRNGQDQLHLDSWRLTRRPTTALTGARRVGGARLPRVRVEREVRGRSPPPAQGHCNCNDLSNRHQCSVHKSCECPKVLAVLNEIPNSKDSQSNTPASEAPIPDDSPDTDRRITHRTKSSKRRKSRAEESIPVAIATAQLPQSQ